MRHSELSQAKEARAKKDPRDKREGDKLRNPLSCYVASLHFDIGSDSTALLRARSIGLAPNIFLSLEHLLELDQEVVSLDGGVYVRQLVFGAVVGDKRLGLLAVNVHAVQD